MGYICCFIVDVVVFDRIVDVGVVCVDVVGIVCSCYRGTVLDDDDYVALFVLLLFAISLPFIVVLLRLHIAGTVDYAVCGVQCTVCVVGDDVGDVVGVIW